MTEKSKTKAEANGNGEKGKRPQRVITNPNDVASLVLLQLDAVNGKKDELTAAIKGLGDTAKQLVRAYAQHAQAIDKLAKRVKELEEKQKSS